MARALGGSLIALAWDLPGQVLPGLRTATGPTAPPTVKRVLGDDDDGGQEPPADLPERDNQTMRKTAFCNKDASRLDLDPAGPAAGCTHWTTTSTARSCRPRTR
ncbi:hypothetical protein [Dactylosporangium sp. CA-233914]|uniref:hypothetical protein n=1 Tax=Dactylosporangium sp. CA-233914 TaxID=3239934 RepID=UPI003D9087A5